MIIGRIAPTPSGHLHLGNIFNFAITYKEIRNKNGILWLRIDDLDSTRTRIEFVNDIFNILQWLGFNWDKGPKNTTDFYDNYSQSKRCPMYWDHLSKFKKNIYTCLCSRKDYSGIYPSTCYGLNHPFERSKSTLRYHIDTDAHELGIQTKNQMGDPILWRREDIPSYQLVSLIEDIQNHINLIVRGEDLLTSSALQIYLAKEIGEYNFSKIKFKHHPLIKDLNGNKMSKSSDSISIFHMKQAGYQPQKVWEQLSKIIYNEIKFNSLQGFMEVYE